MAHNHQVRSYNRAFAIGVALNVAFVLIEGAFGLFANSLALLADAGHNLSDVLSLLLAWGASVLAGAHGSERRTYGFRKATVMAALLSAVLLMVALGGIAWEAIGRLRTPSEVQGTTVIVVAAVGVVINSVTALLFAGGARHDLNVRGAFLHMAADAAISVGVVVAGIYIVFTGQTWVDPATSLAVVVVIFLGTWGLLRESFDYAMDAAPKGIDVAEVRAYLCGLERVDRIHDLHIWPLSTTEVALTVHLVLSGEQLDNRFLRGVQQALHDRFGIDHSTIQLESASGDMVCLLDAADCG
jgi:cobalt-zinc-cadmium efflux system protein